MTEKLLQEYSLVWNDEFEGFALDDKKWAIHGDMGGSCDLIIADESVPGVISVINSELQLRAMKDGFMENGDPQYVTNCSIATFDRMHFKYGYLEMRAKVPYKRGAWPSFWMKSSTGRLLPKSLQNYMTEVDVFEIFSSPDTVVPNLHKWYTDNTHTQSGCKQRYRFKNCDNLSNEYHVYGFEWTPEEMSMYVDDEKYYTFDLSDDFDGGGSMEGFHDPLYIILNNHLFTPHFSWIPSPNHVVDDSTEFPVEYFIDYVRLYQKPGIGKLFTEA